MRLRLLPTLVLCLAAVQSAVAATFITPDAIDPAELIPPPPPDDSPAGRADLETVLQLQASRTPEQIAQATRVANQNVFTFAAPVLGDWFNAENLPRTSALFHQITQEGYAVALQTKHGWTRPRPHVRDPRIEPVPRRSRSPAYPSGHASDAATWWIILSELFPEHHTAFEEQVHEVMWGRVLGGSHFPTDTHAGKTLGIAIGKKMLTAPAMAEAFLEMRREIAPFLAHASPRASAAK